MPDIDFHAQCVSRVRISQKDLDGGRFVYVWQDDTRGGPSTGVKIGSCELAAAHDGRCEMFVDGEGHAAYWISWARPDGLATLADAYQWIIRENHCQEESPAGYHCVRYADHGGGHAFTVEP